VTRTIWLEGDSQRQYAKDLIDMADKGHVVKLGAPTRTDKQNRLLHPLLQLIMDAQPERWASMEVIKLTFMDSLSGELHMLPKLDGQGFFPVGRKTSTLTVAQFSGLLDLVYQYAAHHGIELPEREEGQNV